MSLLHDAVRVESLTVLSRFRTDFYDCLTARADALFELTDAVLCTDGPVRSLVDLALAPEHRRGHGSLYAGLNRGGLDVARLRRVLAGAPLPRAGDGRLVLAVDVSPWLRPDASTVPDRSFCHTYGRGSAKHQMMPGWPYSFIVALETGRTSWTAVLDALRLTPGADLAAVTTTQVREVVERLIAAGQWCEGDPEILIVLDAGYDAPRIAHLLSGLPVQVLGRLRSDRVMRRPTPPRVYDPKVGRPPKHGGEFIFGDSATWGEEQAATVTDTRLYGKATAQAWDRLHPRLTRRAAWLDHDGPLPIIEGTVIRLAVAHLPSSGVNKPVWLWWSRTGATPADVDRCWQAFLRRFDIEHTFRMLKQTLGWTRPRLRDSAAADRWTWLIVAAHTQLRLARPFAADLRRPCEKPAPADKLTPARVRRGFRNLRTTTGSPAGAPKPTWPGPGRPPGSKNRRPAPRHDVGRVLTGSEVYQRPAHHQKGTKPRRKPNYASAGGHNPTNEATIQQWNTVPRKVMEAMEPDGDFAKRHLINPVLLRMLGDVRGLRVLDAGCGQGYLSRMLAARGAHVTGVEPTDAMFTYSQEREQAHQQGIRYVQADLSQLPDLGGGYDAVVCSMVLPAIPDWKPAMRNCVQSLRPGGLFIFSVNHPAFEQLLATWREHGEYRLRRYLEEYEIPLTHATDFHRPISAYLNWLYSRVVPSVVHGFGECLINGGSVDHGDAK